jgi:uncharacterized membrane protein YadS
MRRSADLLLAGTMQRIHCGLWSLIKGMADVWTMLRRTQIISFPLFLTGVALMTFLESTYLIGPETLMIAVRTCALGMLACSTLAYGFAVAFARVETRRS